MRTAIAKVSSHRPIGGEELYHLLTCVILLAFFLFVAFRAFSVPFTHDESHSFFVCASPYSLSEIVLNPAPLSNNHILNTVFLKLAGRMLPLDDWTLRLYSLLSYALFLCACFLICRQIFAGWQRLMCLVLLNANMFLLQFFSLARGYALALSFMMVSVWLFLRTLEIGSERRRYRTWAFVAAFMACTANIAFLNYYIALLLVDIVFHLRTPEAVVGKPGILRRIAGVARSYCGVAFVSAALAVTLLPFAIKLHKTGEFYYGGNSGFAADTAVSLINSYLYVNSIPHKSLPATIRWFWAVIGLITLFYFVRSLTPRRDIRTWKAIGIYSLLAVSAASTVVLHFALGTLYLIDRTALLFVPLFVLSVTWLFTWCTERKNAWVRLASNLLVIVALGLAVWQFARSANVSYALMWKYDAGTKDMLRDLEVYTMGKEHPERIRLGVTWYLQPSVAFYARVKGLTWLDEVDRDGVKDRVFDFYYITDEDIGYLRNTKAELIKQYEPSGTRLLRAARH
jgi:hypothetical protein